jgi:uncharacterized protein YjbI with pentapeptide repeats
MNTTLPNFGTIGLLSGDFLVSSTALILALALLAFGIAVAIACSLYLVMQPTWKRRRPWARTSMLWSVVIALAGGIDLLIQGAFVAHHGGEQSAGWEIMKFLAIPLATGLAVASFAYITKRNELVLAEANRQESDLDTYVAAICDTIRDQKLSEAREADKTHIRIAARTRTLTTLRLLDGRRRGILLRFLYEAHLLEYHKKVSDGSITAERGLICLREADLRGAKLRGSILNRADLRGALLEEADLREAKLRGVNFGRSAHEQQLIDNQGYVPIDIRGADLTNADLCRAVLSGADLRGALLRRANFHGADLTDVQVDTEELKKAKTNKSTRMSEGLRSRLNGTLEDQLQVGQGLHETSDTNGHIPGGSAGSIVGQGDPVGQSTSQPQ